MHCDFQHPRDLFHHLCRQEIKLEADDRARNSTFIQAKPSISCLNMLHPEAKTPFKSALGTVEGTYC